MGCFGHVQTLTYTTTVPLLVPPQHHVRATSMGAIAGYSTGIIAPALAGLIYPLIGLLGITAIDLITFAIVVLCLLPTSIPSVNQTANDKPTSAEHSGEKHFWHEITFGFRYICNHSNLRVLVIMLSLFALLHQLGETLYQPMVLARTNGNAQILGTVIAASGVGGGIGGAFLAISGGFRDRIRGIRVGILGVAVSTLLFGLGHYPILWIAARLGISLSAPLIFSSYMAVWYAQVPPALQGRVLAADHLIGLAIGYGASLVAGPLADYVFEPIMQSKGSLTSVLDIALGTGTGTGIALLHILSALGLCVIGVSCYTLHLTSSSPLQHSTTDKN